MRYENFDVRIGGEKPSYEVNVSSPAGEAHGRFQVPQKVEAWAGGPPESRSSRHVKVVGDPPREIAERLSDALFSEKVLAAFQLSLQKAHWKRKGLRIRLWLPPRLSFLPWEHLRNPESGQPLAISPRTPFNARQK